MANRDSYYKQKFYCNHCKQIVNVWIWLSELDNKYKHEICKKKLTLVFEEKEEGFSIGGKFINGRNLGEKRKRATDHFKKEIMPTLSGPDRQYFENKHRKKK